MNFDINQILQIARILGQVLTEVSQIKDAIPQQEAATRGIDNLAVAKGEVDQIIEQLKKKASRP